MDMDRAIELIGTASDDPVMVSFLNDSGVRKMPSWKSSAAAAVRLDSGGIILQFSSDVPDGKEDRAPGTIFLEDITFSNPAAERGVGPLTQNIPYGLHIHMDGQQIKRALGTPFYEGEFMGGLFLTYTVVRPGVDLTIKLDRTGQVIQFVRFSATTAEHGNG